jgi:iron complex outermembrane recepter protein
MECQRNGDSTSTKVSDGEVVGRQLRQEADNTGDFDYQFEPVWRFNTGPAVHSLVTGFEYLNQILDTNRSTANLFLIFSTLSIRFPRRRRCSA